MEFIKSIIPYVPYLCIVIIAATVWAWFYIDQQKSESQLIAKRRIIEMIPSAVSTLGVLGTFLGITLGLICFNTGDLPNSIPQLLEGLKTAFFTSLAGMIGSLLLSRKINRLYDEESGGVTDINQAASIICQSVSDFQAESSRQTQAQAVFYNLIQTVVQQMNANISTINANINNLNTATNNIAVQLQGIATNAETIATTTKTIQGEVESIDGLDR